MCVFLTLREEGYILLTVAKFPVHPSGKGVITAVPEVMSDGGVVCSYVVE